MRKVMLAGEGKNELGKWAHDPAYRNDCENDSGVIEELLKKVEAEGWEIAEGVLWKTIRKYISGGHRKAERRNVVGLVKEAKDMGCDVVVFVRDRDGSRSNPNNEREKSIEEGINEARKLIKDCPDIIGGVAIKMLESWLLALCGKNGSEKLSHPKNELRKQDVEMTTAGCVELVRKTDFHKLPEDAVSFNLWIERAGEVLRIKEFQKSP